MSDVLLVLGYGLLAAASPTALLATLVVLGSGRGRPAGIAFAAAFVLGQSVAFLIGFLIGSAITPSGNDTASSFATFLELAAGVALLALAWRQRSRRGRRPARRTPRTEALFARLADVRPAVSFGIGLPLGIGAKRLIVTFLAATTVALAGLNRAEEVSLFALYVTIATLVVWVPVGLYLIFGKRADESMARTRLWITEHEDGLTVITALVLGLLFVADALVALV